MVSSLANVETGAVVSTVNDPVKAKAGVTTKMTEVVLYTVEPEETETVIPAVEAEKTEIVPMAINLQVTSEEGIVSQEIDQGGGNDHLQEHRPIMDILDTGLSHRKETVLL